MVEAEALGEDWGWEACGEREQRALAGPAGGDVVCFEPVSEVVGAEVPARVAAWEQPVACGGVAVDFEGERGEGFGEREDAFAELDRDLVFAQCGRRWW